MAAAVTGWLASQVLPARDAIVLLPQAGLLGPARAAFARRGGWQPRVETRHTLAASLAPPPGVTPGMLSLDRTVDRLTAGSMLQAASFWAARDRAVVEGAGDALVDTAHTLFHAAADRLPADRPAWWVALRQALPALAGPGTSERWLAQMALEWAAAADPPAGDVLVSLQPAAWVVMRVAGVDAMPERLLGESVAPVLWLEADGDAARPFDAAAALPAPSRWRAANLEDEASAAAVAVLDALDRGLAPIALIAQDRLCVRRIRALLERADVSIDDETGWTLSTTRAAALLMAWLRGVAVEPGRDAQIEAMRAEQLDATAVNALEDAWRRERAPTASAQAVAKSFAQATAPFGIPGQRSITAWIGNLRNAASGLMAALAADAAGRQVLAALHLNDVAGPATAWRSAADATRCDLAGFTAWVAATLEAASWLPPASASAQVVITPLTRAVLRPFGAVVFPGCDEQHLGGGQVWPSLLPDAQAREFGIADAAQRRLHEALAFAQLLRTPELTLLRRTHEAGEALAPSPLVERALLARRRINGQAVAAEREVVLPQTRVLRRPVTRPAPAMAQALPARLSASSVEALRACPYRFFARVALGLSESGELDAAIDKTDYGRWLHAVLHRFHTERSGSNDRAELLAAADAVQAQQGLDAASLLPYRAGFDNFAANYLAWLHARDAQGWRFSGGELERRCAPPDLDGLVLDGRLDRVDLDADGAAMLIDYKTSSPATLAKRVRDPLEDTQLAFYAALLTDEPHDPPPRAIYLALDEREPPKAIEHPDVARSAALLVDGLAADLAALRAGVGAGALGEGESCTHCDARGLCRRDDWSAA